jgi:hypothetical protein
MAWFIGLGKLKSACAGIEMPAVRMGGMAFALLAQPRAFSRGSRFPA